MLTKWFFTVVLLVLVFGIPFFTGWVVLRRVTKERDSLFLAPAGCVLGLGILTALINELRFFLEMNLALWFTYKIMIVISTLLLMINVEKPRLLWSGFLNNWRRLALLGGSAIFVSVYFGIPAFKGVLNDGWWCHYLFATSIQTIEKLPLPPAFSPDDMVYYHYGPDILAATWSYLFNQPVQFGFALNVVLFVLLTFLLTFSLVYRATKSFLSSILSGVLILLCGNLKFLYLLGGHIENTASILYALNSQSIEGLSEMVFTPSHLTGIPFCLTAIGLFINLNSSPSWPKAIVFGILMGFVTLMGEWYFLMLFAACFVYFVWSAVRKRRRPGHKIICAMFLTAFSLSLLVGMLNNSYLSGHFSLRWLKQESFYSKAQQRNMQFQTENAGKAKGQKFFLLKLAQTPIRLISISLNISHFGSLPNWAVGGSNAAGWVPLVSKVVLTEAFPALGLGLCSGCFLWRKRRKPLVFMLTTIALLGILPPVFLEWGFRSTDFLRFLVVSHAFGAVLLAMMISYWISLKRIKYYVLGGLLATLCFVNPVILGVIGLAPDTFQLVDRVHSTASSLGDAIKTKNQPPKGDAQRNESLQKLSVLAGDFLYPITKGRDRVAVIVPIEYLPPQELFPEWLKIATYARINIPVGRHWEETPYVYFYRRVATELDALSIAVLDVEYIILTNFYEKGIPDKVINKLKDPGKFMFLTAFKDDRYWMKIYKVVGHGAR